MALSDTAVSSLWISIWRPQVCARLAEVPRVREAFTVGIFLMLALSTIWVSIGDHPLAGRSEGRYAAVSLTMAQTGNWLVPELLGHPHLTKPPLTYWLEALAIRAIGPNELAVRLPSAIASSLTLVGLLALGWRVGGRRIGYLAAAVLSVMPLHIIMARMTLTDALLGLFWFGTLACGYMALVVSETVPQRRRWAALMWGSVAMGMMVKGPVVLLAIAVILMWLLLAGNWRRIGELHPFIGLPLAAMPVAGWALLVLYYHPEAAQVWYEETVSRAVGTGDHPQPMWYFLPVFLGGLFPATAMLNLPLINYRAKAAWQAIRQGEGAVYWALAVVLPFIVFSLNRGKLASYLLPLCPPLALLTACMLDRWITGQADRPTAGVRLPEVVGTPFICLAIAIVAAVGGAVWQLGAAYFWLPLPLLVLLAANGWVWHQWKRRPSRRLMTLATVWIVTLLAISYVYEMQDEIAVPASDVKLLEAIQRATGIEHPHVVTVGFKDMAMSFYTGQSVPQVDELLNQERLDFVDRNLVVVAEPGDWQLLVEIHPGLTASFQRVLTWQMWPLKQEQWVFVPAIEQAAL